MVLAVELVRNRLLRATSALNEADIPHAVAGGHAVAAWVTMRDVGGVRNTPDIEILLRRSDLGAATQALKSATFTHRHVAGRDIFLDGPNAKERDAVHVVIAGEKVRPQDDSPTPDVSESEQCGDFRIVTLESLVRMKLASFRCKDRVHLIDMFDVGLIDATWPARFPPTLAARLQHLIDTPDN